MSLAAEADFGLSLLRETSFNSTTVLSPISIALALSLVHAGAKGSSRDQIKNALCKGSSHEDCANHFSVAQKALVNRDHPYYKNWMYCSKPGNISCVDENERYRFNMPLPAKKEQDLLMPYIQAIPADYPLRKTGVLVNIANRIFVGNQINVKKAYQEEISTKYGAQLQSLDIANKAAAAKIVNEFVENETMGKIKNLLNEGSFNDVTAALLVNAIYFHGRWARKIRDHVRTEEGKFHAKEGESKQVTYMRITKERFPFSENDDFMVLSLPYQADNVFFTVLLPKERFGLSSVLRNLTGEKLHELISSQKEVNVDVKMPKFKLDAETALSNILKKLGIVDPFTDKADLSGITGDILTLGGAKHKVTIDVNEMGTTAAASTVLELVQMSGRFYVSKPIDFTADHPFLFLINHGGHILFTGQYYALH